MFIQKTTIIKSSVFDHLNIDVLAVTKDELQVQIKKSDWEDLFIDLDLKQAKALRDSLNLFIENR